MCECVFRVCECVYISMYICMYLKFFLESLAHWELIVITAICCYEWTNERWKERKKEWVREGKWLSKVICTQGTWQPTLTWRNWTHTHSFSHFFLPTIPLAFVFCFSLAVSKCIYFIVYVTITIRDHQIFQIEMHEIFDES